jgi:hypothetical protein
MTFMKMRFALIALPLAFAGLGACSTYGYGYDDYGYSDYGYSTGYGYGDYGYGYGQGGSYSGGVWHDAYYDNHYGAVRGGYWDLDGFFWYQSVLNGPYLRDHNRHFRRDDWNGGKHYRYVDRRNHGGRDWNDRDRDRNTYPPLFAGQQGGNRDWNQNRNNDRNGGRDGNDGRDRNDDRGRNDDRARNEGGNRYNPPPLFSGQQSRATPAPPPQLDGAPRGGDNDRNRDRGNDNDSSRGDGDRRNDDRSRNNNRSQGGSPPLFSGQQQQRALPAPSPPQQAPQAQPRQRSDDDGDRPQRGQRNNDDSNGDSNGDRGRSRGKDRRGERDRD